MSDMRSKRFSTKAMSLYLTVAKKYKDHKEEVKKKGLSVLPGLLGDSTGRANPAERGRHLQALCPGQPGAYRNSLCVRFAYGCII
jgi:hypothetical protein